MHGKHASMVGAAVLTIALAPELSVGQQAAPSGVDILIVCGDENRTYMKCTSLDDRFLELHLRLDMGHSVTMMPDDAAEAEMQAAADAADLVIIPESVLSNSVGMKLVRMELGEPDASGRRSAVPVAGSEFVMPIDVAIIAIGTGANPLVQSSTPDLNTNKWGYIVVDPRTWRTSRRGVFAGGDIVSGAATVILAMGAGRAAARSIHEYLATGEWESR